MTLRLHTAPTGQVVTTAEAKAQARVTHSAEDALIDLMIQAASSEAEHLMARAILPQQWRLTLDAWVRPVPLRMPPVRSVLSVQYADPTTGTMTLLDSGEYVLAHADDLGVDLYPAYGKSWPAHRTQPDAIEVIFEAGYANAAAVPAQIKTWILMRVAAYYRHREAWTLGTPIERNEHLDRMLDRFTTIIL